MSNDGMQVGAVSGANRPAQATFRYSIHNQSWPLAGKTLGEVKAFLADKYQLPGDATGYAGKEALQDSYVVQPGDQIEFTRRSGEKGR